MERNLDKNILKPYIDLIISRLRLLYGFEHTEELVSRLNNISRVFVSDDPEIGKASMSFLKHDKSIRIRESFIPKDSNGNDLVEFDKTTEMFKISLIHELLHAASSRGKENGIMVDGEEIPKYSLNEGITQMLAEDICGFKENKVYIAYNLEKSIANVLRACYGNDKILYSYFFDTFGIDNLLVESQISKSFTPVLHSSLLSYHLSSVNEKNRRMDSLIKLVVINVVVPTYNEMKEEDRKSFLVKLIYSLNGDEEIKAKFIQYINEYLKDPGFDLLSEHNRIIKEYESMQIQYYNVQDLSDLKQFIVRNDGSVLVKGEPCVPITSKEDLDKIYVRLFELNGYDKYMTPNVIKAYAKNILEGTPLVINQSSILQRRIMFCGIKEYLYKEGIYVLNDYEELDKNKSIHVNWMKRRVDFEDYKKLSELFSICKTKVGKDEYTYSVIYNTTKNEVEDPIVKRAAYYALNWASTVQSNGREEYEEAYSMDKFNLFNAVLHRLMTTFETQSTFDVDVLAGDGIVGNTIRKLLMSPVQVEWVHDYLNILCNKESPYKERIGYSTLETENPNYHFLKSIEEACDIVEQNM